MPATGWDAPTHGDYAFDDTAASLDPSFYYALSPGGRFPGDVWAYLEGLAGQDRSAGRTSGDANPNYDLPSWLEHIPGRLGNLIARMVRGHESNVRNNADAAVHNPLQAGDVYQGWSGVGAPYGPEGGPLHGTLDQGTSHLNDYDYGYGRGLDPREGLPTTSGHRGRGGDNFGPLNWQPYAGTQHASQFVDYQPIAPFTVDTSPTRFVSGRGGTPARTTAPTAPAPPPFLPAGGTHSGHGGRGSGAAGGRQGQQQRHNGQGGRSASDPAMSSVLADVLAQLFGPGAGTGTGIGTGTGARGNFPGNIAAGTPGTGHNPLAGTRRNLTGGVGYDTGYTGRGTPGWMLDPTTGIRNTAGMPLPTPLSRGQFGTDDDYITAMHDLGFDMESIIGSMNPWGTGGVVRGSDGSYMFANDPNAQENPYTPGHFGLFGNTPGSYGNTPGSSAGGFGGTQRGSGNSGGGGGSAQPNAADSLMSGWNPYLI